MLMAIPILMILLSTTLPARVNRATNLVVATLYIPASMYNVAGEESWTYSYFYGLSISIGLEVLLLAFARRMDLSPDHSSRRRPRPRPGPGVKLEAGPMPVVGDLSSGEQRLGVPVVEPVTVSRSVSALRTRPRSSRPDSWRSARTVSGCAGPTRWPTNHHPASGSTSTTWTWRSSRPLSLTATDPARMVRTVT